MLCDIRGACYACFFEPPCQVPCDLRLFMEPDVLHSTSSHWNFVDEVSEHLLLLFHSVRAGEKAWMAAQRLSIGREKAWSAQLDEDLIRAAKVLASAWRFRGKF